MPSLAPRVLKRILELDGFSVTHEDDYNWALVKSGVDEVVIVPKLGEAIADDVLSPIAGRAPRNGTRYLFSRS